MKGFKGTPGPWKVFQNRHASGNKIGERYSVFASVHDLDLRNRDDRFLFNQFIPKEADLSLHNEAFFNSKLIGNSLDIASALKILIHLHSCEQEGLSSGMPTREQWLKAYDDGVAALEKAGIDLSEI